MKKEFAEVIESSLSGWLAQSWRWNQFPIFGSLVTIETNNRTLFGIVHQIQTGSLDPIRYPVTYQKTEEELVRDQPQIFEFLKTTFSCLTVGYKFQGTIYYQLAPEPPKIHAFVAPADPEHLHEFFSQEQYLPVLFGLSNQLFNLDELLLALIKNVQDQDLPNAVNIQHFIQQLSLHFGNDYRRLKLFLQRLQPLLQ